MNLLRYEFIDGPDDSYNGMLRSLVKAIRYGRSQVTIEEFKKAMLGFHVTESRLQKIDEGVRNPKRNYIQEIMAELDQEQDDADNLVRDLEAATVAMMKSLLDKDFDFTTLSFNIGKSAQFHWVGLNGYKEDAIPGPHLLLVREVFRSICSTYKYIFWDLSA